MAKQVEYSEVVGTVGASVAIGIDDIAARQQDSWNCVKSK